MNRKQWQGLEAMVNKTNIGFEFGETVVVVREFGKLFP